MFRSMTALLAFTLLMAAAPAQRQPMPSSAPSNAAGSDPVVTAVQKREAEQEKSQKATEARDKAWDAKTKSTLSTICRGC